jgi:hypothetical protein
MEREDAKRKNRLKEALGRLWGSMLRSARNALVVGLLGLAACVLLVVLGERSDPPGPENTIYYWWVLPAVLLGIVATFAGLFAFAEGNSRRRFARGDRQERISRLTKNLEEAVHAIEAIQGEIREGEAARAQLERDLKTTKAAAELSEEQAAAVADIIRSARPNTTRRDIVLMLAGAAIGAVLSSLFPAITPWG